MSDPDFKDYYQILGVSHAASDEEISAAYRTLAAKYHPDISEHDDNESLRFKEVSHAYQVLSDPKQRRNYDQQLARHRRYSHPARRQLRSAYGFVEPLSSSEQVIEADLPVTPEEARYGATVSVMLNLPQSCRACGGKGVREDKPCQPCNATGSTRIQHRLGIVIVAGTRDGAGVRIRTTQQTILLRVRIRPCW